MRIMCVGEATVLAKISEHLRAFGEVEEVETSKFHAITQGTEWVCILDGGKQAGRILSAAGRADARAVSIPTAWAHAEEKLRRAGFFAAVEAEKNGTPKPVERPFAVVADAVLRRAHEREEAEKKAREAMERGMNPPPPPECSEGCGRPAVEEGLCEDCYLARPSPTPPPAAEEEAPGITPSSAPLPPPEGPKVGRETREPRIVESRERTPQSFEKERRLEQFFEWNPDLSISDASKMLAGVSPDGRALGWNIMSDVRWRVRSRLGLEPKVRRYSRIDRIAPGSAPEPASLFTRREDEGDRTQPARGATPAVPPAVPPGIPLPKNVEDAARMLREELERAPEVGDFTLTYTKGTRARVRWRPDVEEDLAL